jgi:MerR family redox-sensitive transcriptional activator SoxR
LLPPGSIGAYDASSSSQLEVKGAGVEMISIGELAAATNRRPSAIRYYEELGLLSPAARIGGRRHYEPEAQRTIAVIDTAQRAGLSLAEIRTLLQASTESGSVLRQLADRRLPQVTALIQHATLVREWLEAASRCECPDLDSCCLFDNDDVIGASPAESVRNVSAPARRNPAELLDPLETMPGLDPSQVSVRSKRSIDRARSRR